ncbi:flagellar FliL protein [Nitrosospira sp. Nsp18]|uniref:flagellar basal body-associated protein FliL n=1 Tax=Nitrosospira sp. Nsp18 TaxID=1855334 RepID=UPI00088D85E0|nr:flagellar basal body-associated protein FliL [Nitrosospira sp. Nsp18]SDA12134.1 flagellar FliL protein [Nitrosospira sp. Nsp18]
MASRLNKQEREYRESAVVDPKQKSKSSKLILVIVSAVLLLGAGAGGAAWYFRQVQDGATPVKKPPVFVSLDTFTVNLQPEHSEQHLQTNLTLKVENVEAVGLIKLHMPEVRNRILLLLSSKAASQIIATDGKKELAAELLAEINQPFSEGHSKEIVESVLFTSFVIQ